MAKRSASAVWEYFTMFQDRLEIAKCNICSQEIRRLSQGAQSKKLLIFFVQYRGKNVLFSSEICMY